MARTEDGLKRPERIPEACARNSGTNLNVTGSGEELNQALEKAGRVADFLEFAN